jgi:hypothetical protein
MRKILITQAIFWAAAIISSSLVDRGQSWLLLTVLAATALRSLTKEINSIQT